MTAPATAPTSPKPQSELKTRLIFGLLLTSLVLYTVWAGVYHFSALALCFACLGQLEFQKFAEKKGFRPGRRVGIGMTILLLGSSVFCSATVVNELMLLGTVVSFTIILMRQDRETSPLLDAALTSMGIIYVGWFFSHLVHLRKFPDGAAILTLLLFCSAFTDMGGYFVGRKFGKTKLYPAVSPKKTWEGAVGGVATSMVAAVGVGHYFLDIDLQHCLAAAVITSIAGQIGDLFESLLKRDVGVKDSGKAIPGHGGALDRFDSLAFAGPIFYLYAVHFML